jgi:23S rRNA pseudouridine2605 synthase
MTRARSTDTRYGIARVLSKRGLCSRSEAEQWIRAGRIGIDGKVVVDPEFPVTLDVHGIQLDGRPVGGGQHRYCVLNKPRGLVTTARDERGRDTVYRCFDGAGLGWIAPVGRLDKASEGLLLFTSDPAWAARITAPGSGLRKTYHVQVAGLPGAGPLEALQSGIDDAGERLQAVSVGVLRRGQRNAWLEVVLDEGRNRHIRRLLAAFGIEVLRLVRVAIGDLQLGELAKGQWRELSAVEVDLLS